MTSPTTGGALPAGVTPVGGIVLDLIGLNGVRVLVQLSADQLFAGTFSPDTPGGNPGTIGVLGGLSPQVLAQLGGGLSQMAVRMSIFDADASVGDIDHNENFLTINGIQIGNLSLPATESTSESGELMGAAVGFQNALLSTGWFHVTDPAVLFEIFGSLVARNGVSFGLHDLDPYDNGYDFSQGLDGSHFEITIPNTAPDATDDVYSVSRNTPLVVSAASGLLANDTDPEGANLTATLVSGPLHGTVTINSDGSFTYVPATGYAGPDSFSYRASDGALGDVAAVNLFVNPNVAPVAGADRYTVDRNGELVVSPRHGVLANDSDPDSSSGGVLTARTLSEPQNGTLTFNADGSFVYVPNPGFYGTDSFAYAASDGDAETPNFVTLTVVNNNAAPVAADDAYRLDKDGILTVERANGVLANDADADGDVLTVEVTTGPANGTLTLNADGSFTYIPNPGFHGSDNFSYRTSDGDDTDIATVTLTVDNVNGAPSPADDAYEVDEGGRLFIDAANGVLANDTDPDGSAMTAQIRTQPSSGVVTLNADGSFAYTPNPGFTGTDSFTYFANDGSDTGYATVMLTVNAVNEAPVGASDTYAMEQNRSLTVDAAHGVLANDSDPDGDPLSVALLTGPQHGQFVLNADGSFNYVPDANYVGSDSFTYSLRDGSTSTPVTVTLTVNPRSGRLITLDDNANRATYARQGEAVIVHARGGADSITGSRFDDELLLGEGADEGIGGNGNDIIRGGAGDDKLFGQAGNDRLEGGDGDDLMHGGDGPDIMVGGVGDDIYYVHSTEDQVIEAAGEGSFDNVRSTVSWTLGDHFEELMLEGSADIDGSGNALDNAVLGNSGANVLYGLDGNDTLGGYGGDDIQYGGAGNDRLVGRDGNDVLHGGTGDDQYFVDTADVIVELGGEGVDTVFSVGDYVLGANLEVLRLDGAADLRGEGNNLNNYIAGTDGDNFLIGHGGDDQVFGGRGDDTLVGDGEAVGNGNDRLEGGDGADTIFGGGGDDVLSGGGGDDFLFGEAGMDRLDGGSGNDVFVFDLNSLSIPDQRPDTVIGFHGAGTSGIGEQDSLHFSGGFSSSATLMFDHYGSNQGQQYYRLVDPEHPGQEQLILVQMAGGSTNLLSSDDYLFS